MLRGNNTVSSETSRGPAKRSVPTPWAAPDSAARKLHSIRPTLPTGCASRPHGLKLPPSASTNPPQPCWQQPPSGTGALAWGTWAFQSSSGRVLGLQAPPGESQVGRGAPWEAVALGVAAKAPGPCEHGVGVPGSTDPSDEQNTTERRPPPTPTKGQGAVGEQVRAVLPTPSTQPAQATAGRAPPPGGQDHSLHISGPSAANTSPEAPCLPQTVLWVSCLSPGCLEGVPAVPGAGAGSPGWCHGVSTAVRRAHKVARGPRCS